jgi:ABC-type nitrate/sulfonate/bicarbonate transport system, permease component
MSCPARTGAARPDRRIEPRALGQGGLLVPAGITVWEALLGFAIGSALGALLGLVLSHWPLLGKSWYPYIVGFQSLPKVALAPLMVVWFGFGLEGKVFITAIITFFPVLVNMMAGYQAVEPERIELARPVTPVSCTSSQKSSSRAACHSCSPGSASLLCYRSSVPWLASSSAPVPASECS